MVVWPLPASVTSTVSCRVSSTAGTGGSVYVSDQMSFGRPGTGRLVVTPPAVWLRPTWLAVQARICWGSPFTCQKPVLAMRLGDGVYPAICFNSLAGPGGGPGSFRAPG